MDAICLITAPRTGTNHLCDVLRNFSELAPYLDVFDNESIQGTDPQSWPVLRHQTGLDFINHKDPRLIAFAHEKPGAWIDALEQVALGQGKRVMGFKLQSQQLPNATIEQDIMTRQGLRTIVIVRKQIDSYISWRKATELGKSQGVDTTGMRITLDADRFQAWLTQQEQWYTFWKASFERRFMPMPVLRYEIDIDQPVERMLKRFAGAAAQLGITLKPPTTVTHLGLTRQDKAKAMGEKVANWSDFSREIFSRGLERRAFGYPL